MGSVLIGAPQFSSLHLLDRLQRELTKRGHLTAFVHGSAIDARLWALQGIPGHPLEERRADAMRAPIDEFAALDARLRNLPAAGAAHRRWRRRCARRLARLLPGLVDLLERTRPDLLLLHDCRDGLHRLMHFAARELGTRVVWLGSGLLPHTLQRDDAGLDGEAAITRRVAGDYRDVAANRDYLGACVTHVLGRAAPAALSRRALVSPPFWLQVCRVFQAVRNQGVEGLRHVGSPDRDPAQSVGDAAALGTMLPETPFATVLLQDPSDPRVLLDADSPPAAAELVAAARNALDAIDRSATLAVVCPRRGLHHGDRERIARTARVKLLPHDAAAIAAMAGLATFTINHPAAVTSMLAGTPVLHCGRALFGLAGVTHRGPSEAFVDVLGRALADETDTLRERMLTVLLGRDHLWCSASEPDHNGVIGLANAIEDDLDRRSPRGARIAYRPGPPWPLATPMEP